MTYKTSSLNSLALEALEDVDEEFSNSVNNFVVVRLECHFDIKADKLSQVTVSV